MQAALRHTQHAAHRGDREECPVLATQPVQLLAFGRGQAICWQARRSAVVKSCIGTFLGLLEPGEREFSKRREQSKQL